MMNKFIFLFVSVVILQQILAQSNDDTCVKCICHSKTSCYNRINCGKYAISKRYWIQAGKPKIGESDEYDDESNDDSNYEACMKNEECITKSVMQYTSSFGDDDVNCDGTFDCKDRLARHYFGKDARNPVFGAYGVRFNHCAKEVGVTPVTDDQLCNDD